MVELEVGQSDSGKEPRLEMPRFELGAYEALLDRFSSAGYATRLISELDKRDEPRRVLYLRHDLDFMVSPSLAFAIAEAERNMRATYYVLLTGPYNAFAVENRVDLRTLAELGHEVGLLYDVRAMTGPLSELRAELAMQLRALDDLVGRAITTISMHNPSISGDDPFRTEPGLQHPHDPNDNRGIEYVSDSCRRWRDERLLACFGPSPPFRVMLLTHPELWLAAEIRDPTMYLRECVTARALTPLRSYFEHEVAALWRARGAVSVDSKGGTRLELRDHSAVEPSLDASSLIHEPRW